MQNGTLRNLVGLLLLVGVGTSVYLYESPRFVQGDAVGEAANTYVSDLTIWRRTKGEQQLTAVYPIDLNHDFHAIPLTIGAWRGQEIEQNNVSALIMLQPEQFLERFYQNERGQYIWLTLIGGRQSRSFHAPEICYTSFGWDTSLSYHTIELGDGGVQGVLIEADKDASIDGRAERHLSFYFYLFATPKRDYDEGIVMFRITSPYFGTKEETLSLHADFLRQFFEARSAITKHHKQMEPTSLVADGLQLNSFALSHPQVASGSVLGVDLVWEAAATPATAYRYDVWLVDQDGYIWSEKKSYRSHIFAEPPPTNEWTAGQRVMDSREIMVLTGTPPGTYDLVVGLYDKATNKPATFKRPSGETIGPFPVLGQVTITRPAFSQDAESVTAAGKVVSGTGLALLDHTLDRENMAPGETVLVTLFWLKQTHQRQPQPLVLTLRDRAGATVQEKVIPAVHLDFLATSWLTGDTWRGQHRLTLKSSLPSDVYSVYLNERLLGNLAVQAPERNFTEPPFAIKSETRFGESITLRGITMNGDESLSLVWRANGDDIPGYHVFVHVVDENGALLMQSDGIPAAWTRPTTGWAAGEYVVDVHTLRGLNGVKSPTLRIGLYDPQTGVRLTSPDGATFVSIAPDRPID